MTGRTNSIAQDTSPLLKSFLPHSCLLAVVHSRSKYMTVLMCFQINEFVKRARAAKIHSYIMGHLKKEMPAMMGKQKAQQRLIDNLEDEFAKVLLQFDMLLSSWMSLL